MPEKKQNRNMRRLNVQLASDAVLNIDPGTIPTLCPQKALDEFMGDDSDPYYKIEAVQYPIKANGAVYLESFFESFIAKMNDRPIPGSRDGHHTEWGIRPPTDLLVVGGRIDKRGDGTGTAYLKNYIPPVGASGDNTVFLKEARSGMIHFSLVSYTRDEYSENPNGEGVWNVIESLKGERNDAVEYDLGAMEQRVSNADESAANPADESGLNHTTLREGVSPAEGEGEQHMTKEEMLAKLSTMKANGDLSVSEIAKTFGVEIVTPEQKSALKAHAEIADLVSGDVVEGVKAMMTRIDANATAVFNARMTEVFGPEKDEDGKENLVRMQANSLVTNGADLEDRITLAKENPILKKLAAERADIMSPGNVLGQSDRKDNADSGKPVVQEY